MLDAELFEDEEQDLEDWENLENGDLEDDLFADAEDYEGLDPESGLAETGLLEALAVGAAEAESEEEEDQFLGAIAGLASSVLPGVIKGVAGGLKRLFGGRRRQRRATRAARRRRATRAARRRRVTRAARRRVAGVVPLIVRRTVRTVLRIVRRGQRVNNARVQRILRAHARRIAANRRLAMMAQRRTVMLARRFSALG